MRLIVRLLDRLFEKRVIVNCERQSYLNRWFLLRWGERLGIYVHQFVRSDEDRALHDHPWDFIVIPLWQGYVEHSDRLNDFFTAEEQEEFGVAGRVRIERRVLPLLGARFRRGTYRRRVELIDEKAAWSLFVRFRRHRVWGFWLPTGFIAWNLWWKEKCE